MENNKLAWKKIGLIIIIVIIIASAWIFYNRKTVSNEIADMRTDMQCAKEGEEVGSCSGCVQKCCSGLKGMSHLKYDGKCIALPSPGSGAICSKCGNGICDEKNNENNCNCPEDCK